MVIDSEEKNEHDCQIENIVDLLLGSILDNGITLEDSRNERLNRYDAGERNT